MPAKILWDDQYTGIRYTYHSRLRPVSQLWLDDTVTRIIIPGQDDRYITVTEPLSEHIVLQYDLELALMEGSR